MRLRLNSLPLLSLPALLSLGSSLCVAQVGYTTEVFSLASPERFVRVADFNHDGRPDVLAYRGLNGGEILLNDGMGGFAAAAALPGGGELTHARVGDMNGDGAPDVVACRYLANGNTGTNALVVYLNDGHGVFTVAQATTLPAGCVDLSLADVNLDGHLDAIAGFSTADATGTYNNAIYTYFGGSSGKVGAPLIDAHLDLNMPSDQTGDFNNCTLENFEAGDFFGDGHTSLSLNTYCASDPADFGTVTLARGDGAGHYTLGSVGYTNEIVSGETEDVNRDGHPDLLKLVSVGFDVGGDFNYDKGAGAGVFTNGGFSKSSTGVDGAYGEAFPEGLTSGNLFNDSYGDLAATLNADFSGGQFLNSDGVALVQGTSNGFTASQHWGMGGVGVGNILIADFNGDGKSDLVTLLYNPGSDSSNLFLYTRDTTTNSCAVPQTENASVICLPAESSTVGSTVAVTAASNVNDFNYGTAGDLTLNRLYLDGTNVYQTTAPSINTSIQAAPGAHTLKLVSYVRSGQAYTTSTHFTVGPTAPSGCTPSAAGVRICAPAAGSTVGSPVTITAGALAGSGHISATRAYIDNVAVFTVNNTAGQSSQQVSQSVSVAAGVHHLSVVGYQSSGGQVMASEDFTVSAAAPCYPTSAGAKICSPANQATVNSPLTLVAGATAGSGTITAVRVYVDSVQAVQVNNQGKTKSFAISHPVTFGKGVHTVKVVGYQSTGGSVTTSIQVTLP